MVALGNVIVLVHIDAELHFLQDDLFLILLRRALFLFLLVQVFAVIHDAANWGDGVGRDLHQVKILFPRPFDGVKWGHYAQLVAISIDHADFSRADALIHADKTFVDSSLQKPRAILFFVGLPGADTRQRLKNYSMGLPLPSDGQYPLKKQNQLLAQPLDGCLIAVLPILEVQKKPKEPGALEGPEEDHHGIELSQ